MRLVMYYDSTSEHVPSDERRDQKCLKSRNQEKNRKLAISAQEKGPLAITRRHAQCASRNGKLVLMGGLGSLHKNRMRL